MIIGLIGHARSGKDTVADYMVRWYGFRKMALADPLKRGCQEIFGWTDAQLYGPEKDMVDPQTGLKPREVMQFVGTELFRQAFAYKFPSIGPDLWVHRMKSRIQTQPGCDWVLTDVRFENEARAVRELDGLIVRISHPPVISAAEHVSECEHQRIEADYTIYNERDLEYLCSQVHTMMKSPNIQNKRA